MCTHTHTRTHTSKFPYFSHLKDEGGILQRIEQHKPVFIEPKQKSSLQDVRDACCRACHVVIFSCTDNGCILWQNK